MHLWPLSNKVVHAVGTDGCLQPAVAEHKWVGWVEIACLVGPSGSVAFIRYVSITCMRPPLFLSKPVATEACGPGSLWPSHFWEVSLDVRKAVHGTSKERGKLPLRDLLSGAGSAHKGRIRSGVSRCIQEVGCVRVWDGHLRVCLTYPHWLLTWVARATWGQELGLWEGSLLQISQKTAT